MAQLPAEAKAGLTRAWLDILAERHPGTAWVVATDHQQTLPTQEAEPVDERPLAA